MSALLTVVLTGECNLCGACCATVRGGERYTCQHLQTTLRPLGNPLAATCRVYGQRVDGMPIVMQAPSGAVIPGVCGKDSPTETLAILRDGIGRGCVLTVEAA